MGLSASMWTSVSGLLAHGEKMSVIGNNIANISTVGFKGSRMDFEDFMSQSIGTAAGVGQVGRGTRAGIVMADFSQGSFESTNSNTDIGITGNGFFSVKPENSNTAYYTRAGNFTFNNDGYLVDPHGYRLQGWAVDNKARSLAATTGASSSQSSTIIGTGIPKDVKLDTFTCLPRHTNNVTLALNLDSATGNDKNVNDDFPFFSLLTNWDATPDAEGKITPLGSQSYAHPQTIEVFDEGGQSHKLTVYFDRVEQNIDTSITGMKTNEIVWEYIVTMDPTEDLRNFSNPPTSAGEVPDKFKGLLMSGTLTFSSSGELKDMSSYVPTNQNMDNLSTWVQAPISSNGYPVLCPNFSGRDDASSAWDTTRTTFNKNADGHLIEFNLGLRSTATTWGGNAPTTIAGWTTFTGNDKQHKVPPTTTQGTLINNIGLNNGQAGVVGPNGLVYATKTTAGTNEILVAGIAYKQKNTATHALGAGEASNAGGWIYSQETDAANSNLPVVTDSANAKFAYDETSDTYYNFGSTGIVGTPAAGALTPSPDLTKPLASSTAVPNTTTPIFKYDAFGNKVPETQTSVYKAMGTRLEHSNTSSTSYTNNKGNNFYEHFINQDGYTYGDLRHVNVSQNGVLSATYSNGVTLELYQITLYDFPSKQNLRREGGNLFTETLESGMHSTGAAASGTFGTTESNNLEQSNVDLSREFVNMITTQRGFQANSKNITTVDTMLETVINMKR